MTNTTNTAPAGIDLDSLTRYGVYGGQLVRGRGALVMLADVESLLARRAAADAPAAPDRSLLDAALCAVSNWVDIEVMHARNVGKGGPGMGKKCEQLEQVATAAIEALAQKSIAHPIGQVSPAIDQPECGMCNDSGIVGFPPDQYEDCPDCAKARAAAGESPAPVCHAPAGPEATPGLLAEILALAESGMCQGLVADDYCSQIVAKIKAAPEAAHADDFEAWARKNIGMPVDMPFVWDADWAKAALEGWNGHAAHAQQDAAPAEPRHTEGCLGGGYGGPCTCAVSPSDTTGKAVVPASDLAAILTDDELCALEYSVRALRAIAERSEVLDGVIQPLNDIRAASRRAKHALSRLEPVARRLCDGTTGKADAASAGALTDDIIEALMHKHDLIGVAGDNPNWEAKLLNFARGVIATSAADAKDVERDMMLWLSDDNEVYANGPDDFANDYAFNCMSVGDDVTVDVDCAHRLPKRTMRIAVVPKGEDDDAEVVWKWVDRAAIAASRKGGEA
jgi:hypothetical protein